MSDDAPPCGYCQSPVPKAARAACPGCEVPFHAACLEGARGCRSRGCQGRSPDLAQLRGALTERLELLRRIAPERAVLPASEGATSVRVWIALYLCAAILTFFSFWPPLRDEGLWSQGIWAIVLPGIFALLAFGKWESGGQTLRFDAGALRATNWRGAETIIPWSEVTKLKLDVIRGSRRRRAIPRLWVHSDRSFVWCELIDRAPADDDAFLAGILHHALTRAKAPPELELDLRAGASSLEASPFCEELQAFDDRARSA